MSTAHTSRIAQRLMPHWEYVAPAIILSDEVRYGEGEEAPQSLRAEASSDGLCFLRIVRFLAHADLYHCLVAPSPELLQATPLEAFFTPEQLTGILPYDCRVQQPDPQQPKKKSPLAPHVILARLSAHARACQPAIHMAPRPDTPILPEPEAPLTSVVELVVTTEEVAAVLPEPGASIMQVQRALLFLALRKLGYQVVRGKEQMGRVLTHTGLLLQQLRRWHRHTEQRVVNIMTEGRWSWRLLIGVPEALTLS